MTSLPRPSPAALVLALAVLALPAARAADFSATLSDSAGKPVADAVLSLSPLDAPAPATPPASGVEIAQVGQQYRPFVTAVRVGTVVEFPNKDDIQHHLYSVSKPKPFEKPLYESGSSETVLFDKPGVVTLGCNIHDWMAAYVVVLETPWFAKSDAQGRAAVAGLPAGRYRVDLWHPRLAAPVAREVSLAADASPAEKFELRLKPERRIRRAPTGESGAY
jgi:plastocyanin